MTRYLIILAAITVGALLGIWLGRRQRKQETLLVEDKPLASIWPWAAGLAVLIVGLFLLASHERAPIDTVYSPATSSNGTISPGSFQQNDEQ